MRSLLYWEPPGLEPGPRAQDSQRIARAGLLKPRRIPFAHGPVPYFFGGAGLCFFGSGAGLESVRLIKDIPTFTPSPKAIMTTVNT